MTLYPSCPITSCNHLCESNLRQSALSAPFCNAKLYAARALPDFCRYLQNGGANNGIVLVLLKSRPPWSVLQGLVCQFINFHYPSRWKVKRFDSDLTIAISMDDATARLKDESNHISLASKCLWIEKMFGTNTGFLSKPRCWTSVQVKHQEARRKATNTLMFPSPMFSETFFTKLAWEQLRVSVKGFHAPVPSHTTIKGKIIQNQKDIEDLLTIPKGFCLTQSFPKVYWAK